MKYLLALQGFLFWFILYFLVRLPLILLGFIVVPIAYKFREGNHFPKWAWIWDNKEDGIFGATWFNKGVLDFKTCYRWSAVRNPANNMRFMKLITVLHSDVKRTKIYGDKEIPNPKLARERGRAIWHLTLVKPGLLWRFSYWYIKAKPDNKHFRIRFGWKCTPEWIEGENLNEINKYSGVTFQLMPNRDG